MNQKTHLQQVEEAASRLDPVARRRVAYATRLPTGDQLAAIIAEVAAQRAAMTKSYKGAPEFDALLACIDAIKTEIPKS